MSLWDDDGKAYLVHGRVGAGPLVLHRMAPDGLSVLDDGRELVNDSKNLPTLEGPKFYKRQGYYYIFAPFGGVPTGSQAVLRSKSIYEPYEHRVVLAQGNTKINGPHQGGYVETQSGHGWFIHFQQRGAHGRIVHLESVRWDNDWPVIGNVDLGATVGEPVTEGPIPDHKERSSDRRPQTSDEFNGPPLGPQWEWNHNPDDDHWSLIERPGFMRLKLMPAPDLFQARNTLTQMMQDEAFELTARLDLANIKDGDHTGLVMFEKNASGVRLCRQTECGISAFGMQGEVPMGMVRPFRLLRVFNCVFEFRMTLQRIFTASMREKHFSRLDHRRHLLSNGGRDRDPQFLDSPPEQPRAVS